jgi:hypothetical protein
MSDDRVLGWDDEISNDSSSQSVVFPPGDYSYEIVNLVRGRHIPKADGTGKLPECPKAEITVRVYGPNGEHSDLKEQLFLHSRCEGMLCSFFRSIGQRKHGEPLRPNWSTVIGSKGRCRLAHRTYKVDGEEKKANDIKSWLDPQQTPAPPEQGGF